MREVLIDHARRRAADRRGGGWRRVPLDLVVDYFEEQELDVVAVHEALDRLAELNERQSQVMTLRYFGGLTVPEVAAALGVSVVTVERDWRLARAWLRGQLRGGGRMTPERWRRIDDLFDAALRLDPAEREAWLRGACGDDDGLRAEVGRLLAQDERADRDGFLTPPEATGRPSARTASWHPAMESALRSGPRPIDPVGARRPTTPAASPPRRRSPPAPGRTRSPSPDRWCGRGCASCR